MNDLSETLVQIPVTNRDYVLAYRNMLQVLRARVDLSIARGRSLQELQDGLPAAGYADLLGGARIGPQLVRFLFLEREQEFAKK